MILSVPKVHAQAQFAMQDLPVAPALPSQSAGCEHSAIDVTEAGFCHLCHLDRVRVPAPCNLFNAERGHHARDKLSCLAIWTAALQTPDRANEKLSHSDIMSAPSLASASACEAFFCWAYSAFCCVARALSALACSLNGSLSALDSCFHLSPRILATPVTGSPGFSDFTCNIQTVIIQ